MNILSPESADFIRYYNKEDRSYVITDYPDGAMSGEDDIPCWSLSALLGAVPGEVSLNSFKDGNWNAAMEQHDGKMIYVDKDSPVDACVELIIKLNELKLL